MIGVHLPLLAAHRATLVPKGHNPKALAAAFTSASWDALHTLDANTRSSSAVTRAWRPAQRLRTAGRCWAAWGAPRSCANLAWAWPSSMKASLLSSEPWQLRATTCAAAPPWLQACSAAACSGGGPSHGAAAVDWRCSQAPPSASRTAPGVPPPSLARVLLLAFLQHSSAACANTAPTVQAPFARQKRSRLSCTGQSAQASREQCKSVGQKEEQEASGTKLLRESGFKQGHTRYLAFQGWHSHWRHLPASEHTRSCRDVRTPESGVEDPFTGSSGSSCALCRSTAHASSAASTSPARTALRHIGATLGAFPPSASDWA